MAGQTRGANFENGPAIMTASNDTLARIAGMARAGRLVEAGVQAAQALTDHPDDGALLALAGAIAFHRGLPAEAVRHLRAAIVQRPQDPVIRANLAESLYHTGDHAGALALCDAASASADPTRRIARLGAHLAQTADDHALAVDLYRLVVAGDSADWQSWNNLGNALAALGRLPEATQALTEAARAAPTSPPIRVNLAETLIEAGRLDDALAVLNRAAADFPDDPHPLLVLFRLHGTRGAVDLAQQALAEAARRAPDRADIQADYGHVLGQANEFVPAETAFLRALAIEPGFTPAVVGLAALLERVNREDELPPLRARSLAAAADARAIAFIDALLAKRENRFADALAALDAAGDVVIPSRLWQLRGQLLDRMGQADAAWHAFCAMNQSWLDDPSDPRRRARGYRDAIAADRAQVSPAWIAGWTAPPAPTRAAPIFLVGFPRSGTTLLDTMLMAVPHVRVLEEEPFITDLETALGGVSALPGLSARAISDARATYFTRVAATVPIDADSVIIDKHPMHLNHVPIIRRLFPDARFILALRHPLDVLFSCYTTNFRLNDAMTNFLDLDDAATLYDQTFAYWQDMRALFAPEVIEVRYEALTADAGAVLRPVFAALNLPWPQGEFDHTRAARARGAVRTASYAQVTQPLYRHAVGRWQRYASQLQPVAARLAPWIARFGYADADQDDGSLV
jgi:Flp pilus assembly protein TadD